MADEDDDSVSVDKRSCNLLMFLCFLFKDNTRQASIIYKKRYQLLKSYSFCGIALKYFSLWY